MAFGEVVAAENTKFLIAVVRGLFSMDDRTFFFVFQSELGEFIARAVQACRYNSSRPLYI